MEQKQRRLIDLDVLLHAFRNMKTYDSPACGEWVRFEDVDYLIEKQPIVTTQEVNNDSAELCKVIVEGYIKLIDRLVGDEDA